MTEDFYDLLDVPSDASQDEIKRAFREKVRIYHPDLNDDDRARAQFTALKKAYDILGDPVERQAYDRLGHEDYVAKRTKGLPSPDVWKTADDDEDEDERDDATVGTAAAGSASGTSGSSGSTGTSGARSSSRTSSGASASSGGAASSASTSGGSGAGADAGTSAGTGADGTGSGTGAASSRGARSPAGRFADNALVRWWNGLNLAGPLLWTAALVYLAGLVHFALGNAGALRSFGAALRDAGTDFAALRSTLTGGRYGVDTVLEFVAGTELVAAPLPEMQWYGALAGVVALATLAVLGNRVLGRGDPRRAVSTNELVLLALALGTATTLLGGPLLAGTVLMPFLYGEIIRRNRRLPGWSPSYGYVACVLAPAVGFAATAAGYALLPVDAAAFVVLPLIGALGFPLRVAVRKRYGR